MGWWPRVECPECADASDPIRIAAQLGRLDFVAMALAVLGVMLALAALTGYHVVRQAAMDAAREEARDRVSATLPTLLTAGMIAEALQEDQETYLRIVNEVRAQIRFLDNPEVEAGEADQIASAAGGEAT